MSTPFPDWLDTFIAEKELDTEQVLEVETEGFLNLIPVGVVLEHMKIAPPEEQAAIQHMLIKLDFYHADVLGFFLHLAKAIAI